MYLKCCWTQFKILFQQGTWKLKQGADDDTRMIYSPLFDGHVAIDENRVVITKVTNLFLSSEETNQ